MRIENPDIRLSEMSQVFGKFGPMLLSLVKEMPSEKDSCYSKMYDSLSDLIDGIQGLVKEGQDHRFLIDEEGYVDGGLSRHSTGLTKKDIHLIKSLACD